MECPRCGLSNTEAARFCPGCGNALGGTSSAHTERPPTVSATLASNDRAMLDRAVLDRALLERPSNDRAASDRAASERTASERTASERTASERTDLLVPTNGLRAAPLPVPEVFELVQRPDSLRPGALEATLASRGHRPAAVGAPLPHLAVISQDGSTGQTYWIDRGSIDIGRDEGDIRLIADRFVSPRHARIYSRNGVFFLRDLGSLNGVYLRVRESENLQDADQMLLGSEVLRFGLLSGAEQGLGAATERGTDVYGSPARPRYACLSERTVEGVYRNVFYISADETVIGREFGDLVFTADSFMSRRHAAVHRDPAAGTFTLRDLGSSNGTYLAIRGEVELREGDHLRVGQHLFRFGFGS
jgi:pSer/pThr/pTyr-binding forkhead associated (FHA) protein